MLKQKLNQLGQELGLNNTDIESVILHNTGFTKNQYFLVDEVDNSKKILKDFEKIIGGYPLQYILSECEFYGRNFYVDKRVLIPRIDTEVMVDLIRGKKYSPKTNFLDIGTGSGIIPVILGLELSGYNQIHAFDISQGALKVAHKNCCRFSLGGKVQLHRSNLLANFGTLDLDLSVPLVITANLPYIKNGDHKHMSKSTIQYEPSLALYGGEITGFELYEKLIFQCIELSQKNYKIELFIEVGFDQKKIASEFLGENELDFEFHKDSATIERVIEIHF